MQTERKSLHTVFGFMGLGFLFAAIVMIMSAFFDYHEDVNALGIAYKCYAAAVLSFMCLAAMATLNVGKTRRKILTINGTWISIGFLALIVGSHVISDNPFRTRYLDNIRYEIPREYAAGVDNYRKPGRVIQVNYCMEDFSAYRSIEPKDCTRAYSQIRSFSSQYLDSIPEDSIRESSCIDFPSGRSCRMKTNTDLGQLSYTISFPTVSTSYAESQEQKILTLLRSWQVGGALLHKSG